MATLGREAYPALVNALALVRRKYAYAIDGVVQPTKASQLDFVVDGEGLGARFGFEEGRPWFGRTRLEEPDVERQIAALLGEGPSDNQLGAERVVLYGCHCGCDYCGVISCVVERSGNVIVWRDVRYEDDHFTPPDPLCIERLEFDRIAYEAALRAPRLP